MKGSVKLPVFIDDARKYVNTTQLRAKYLGASYEAEYCQWQTLHGLGSLMETASLIITPNAYLEGKLIASYPPDPIGDFDVTRATTATRVNSAGLVELVPYNLAQYSEQFDNAYWNKINTTINSNIVAAPDGTQTADKLIGTTGISQHAMRRTISDVSSGFAFTSSIYAKAGEVNILAYRDSTYGTVSYFNLSTGIVTPGANHTCTATPVGNGWYRCSVSVLNLYPNLVVYWCLNDFSATIGDGTSGLYLWGAQVVEGSTAKEYQKTETRLNIPRLDYSNGTCPSILVEPQRTNLLTYSSSFDNAAWIKSSGGTGSLPVITPNTTISPSGVQDADTIVLNSGAGTTPSDQSQFYQLMSVVSGTKYTMTFYAKGVTGGEQIMVRHAGAGSYTKITLTNEWARYSVTETAVFTGVVTPAFLIRRGLLEPINASATFYLWGAQVEAGNYASSYIPTTSASVTRNADVISKTGISSLIGQTEGTLFFDIVFPQDSTASYIGISDGTTSNRIILGCESGTFYTFGYGVSTLPLSINTPYKIAMAYNSTNMKIYANGSLIATISGSVPSGMSRFAFDSGANTQHLIASVKAAALWETKLSDTQLAQLTTI